MTVGTCAAASAAAAEQRAPTVVLMVVSGCAVAMFMTIGYELIYSFIEIRRYEGEGQKVGQESRVKSQEVRRDATRMRVARSRWRLVPGNFDDEG